MTFRIVTYKAFSPSEISGLVAWWDASTLTGADGSEVTALYDSSTNMADVYSDTTGLRPLLRLNELNNRNVIEFDGVNDVLQTHAPFNVRPTNVSSFHGCNFSFKGNYYVHSNSATSPFFLVYKKIGDRFIKMNDPATLPTGTTYEASFSNDEVYLTIPASAAPRIHIYKNVSDVWTKLSNPATLPNGTCYSSSFSNNTNYLAVAGNFSSPSLRAMVYKRSGDTFTALSFTTGIASGNGYCCKFSPDDNFLVVGTTTTPFLYIYSRSGDVFTAMTSPITLPTGEMYSISWLSETIFAVCGNFSTILVYEYNGLNFELQQSINVGSTLAYDLAYSRNKNYLAIASNGASINNLRIFKISGSTYTALPNVTAYFPAGLRGVSWGYNDEYLGIAHGSLPCATMLKRTNDNFENMNKTNMLKNVQGATMFMVIKHNTTAYSSVPLNIASGTTAGYRAAFFTSPTNNKHQLTNRILDSDSAQSINGTTDISTNWIIITGVLNFATRNRRIYINGRLDAQNSTMNGTGTTTSNTDSVNILLGRYTSAGYQFNGFMADSLVFNRALTDDEISNMHKYLSVKWGITLEA